MSRISRCLTVLTGTVASLAALSCGGDNLVLPSEGTAARVTIVSGNPQSGTVGAALADSLVVRVLDQAGRPVPSQPVSWSVVAGGGSVAPASTTTDQDGRTAASWTLGSGAGTQQVRAKPTGNGAPDTLQALFAATAGASSAADLAKLSGDNQTAVAGSVLPDSLVVRVTDASSNPVAGVQVTWTLSGGGAVSSAATPTGADGRAAVQRTRGATAGSQTTTASVGGLQGSPVVFTSTATVGSAGSLIITQQPSSSAPSGAAFPQQPKVQIQDANGNPVSLAGIAVQAAFASNPGAGNLVGNSTATTDATGLATFQNLGISGPAGSYTLNFSVPNRTDISGTPPSATITVSAGSAARLRFAVQPTSIATGGIIAPAVTVQVQDALGNLVSSATTAVTVGLGVNPSGATLSGTKTANAIGGIATFAGLSLNRPGTGYTLSASASGLSGDASSPFNVTTGAATTIAANSSTSLTGTAGSPVTPKPSVKVTDGSGNPVGGVDVIFTVTAGGGSPTSPVTVSTQSDGTATISNWTLGPAAGSGNNKMTASASGLAGSPVTFTASASAGSAGKLGFVTQPASSGISGQALSPQPVLQLLDENDNPVTTGGISVTAAIANGPGGSLSGASVNTNSQGRASFTNLRISGPPGIYQLAFSAPSITGATSNDISIAAGTSTQLGVVTQPNATAQSGVTFTQQPVIRLEDASGNPVAQAGINVVASVIGGGPTLGGDNSKVTDANGEATFTDLKLTGSAGTYSLLFSAAGKTSVASNDIALDAGPVSASVSTAAASPTTFEAGDAGGSTITVTAKDQSGNAVNGATVSPIATNGGSFAPPFGTTDGSGHATFTFTATAAGAHQISVTAGGTVLDDKPTVTVSSAPVNGDHSTLTLVPSSVEAGSGSSIVTVTAKDQFDNTIAGASVTLSVSGSDNTISPNPMATNASGEATFTVSSTKAEGKTLSATINSISVTQTGTLTFTPGVADAGTSTVVADSPVATDALSNVIVTVLDQFGNPVAGATVTLAETGGGGSVNPPVAVTDASGQASGSFSSPVAGTFTIQATVNGVVTISQTPSIVVQ
jgi:hypothetical protein